MRILNTKNKSFKKTFFFVVNSKRGQSKNNLSKVTKIINQVKNKGDLSLIKYTEKFDNIKLTTNSIKLNNVIINKKIRL